MKLEFSNEEASFTGGLDKPLETKGSYTIPELFPVTNKYFHVVHIKHDTDNKLIYVLDDGYRYNNFKKGCHITKHQKGGITIQFNKIIIWCGYLFLV